jgi:hypothetical protein
MNMMNAKAVRDANKAIYNLSARNYFPGVGTILADVQQAVEDHGGTFTADTMLCNIDDHVDGQAAFEVDGKRQLVYGWHRMDSGNFEITCYLS